MSNRKRKAEEAQKKAEEQTELTRKEQRLRQRDRERHKKLYTFVGIALGLALALVAVGVIYQFLIVPNQQVARVGDVTINERQFWKRIDFERASLQNQLQRYQQLEQQFGGEGSFFAAQISQIQTTLASPFALGQQALNNMLEELVVAKEAAARGITVTDQEVDEELRNEIANGLGLVTEPQATATAEGIANATATAASWTPTPTQAPVAATASDTVTGTGSITGTAVTTATAASTVTGTATVTGTESVTASVTADEPTATPTEAPLPTPIIITETTLTEGLAALEKNFVVPAGLTMAEYREIIRARLLRDRLSATIGAEDVTTTEEQVRASHILLRPREPEPTPTPLPDGAPTPEPTATATPLPAGAPTPEPTPAPRDDDATKALAEELRQRILAGEDFATLAKEYSEDPGSAVNGGDLGWFGRGMMVAPFETAAFSLTVGAVSEPVKTDFGYHIIKVTEKDAARPKDEATISQEEQQAFQTWLQTQLDSDQVQRPDNLLNLLPSGM
jgi:hypothetical protein